MSQPIGEFSSSGTFSNVGGDSAEAGGADNSGEYFVRAAMQILSPRSLPSGSSRPVHRNRRRTLLLLVVVRASGADEGHGSQYGSVSCDQEMPKKV